MATAHKIDLKGMMTDLTGDGAGVAPDSIPAIGQRQPTCDSALPTGDDAMPVLVEIDLRDHDGVCHGSCAFCAGCRLASPSLPFIGVSGTRLERGQGRPRRRDRSAAACALPSGLSDSNRTILAAKELHHIPQTLVRHLITPRCAVTLYEARHSRLNDGPNASGGCPNNHWLIKSLGTKLGGTRHPLSISQICLTTNFARLLSQSLLRCWSPEDTGSSSARARRHHTTLQGAPAGRDDATRLTGLPQRWPSR